jgi:hypothetical protein
MPNGGCGELIDFCLNLVDFGTIIELYKLVYEVNHIFQTNNFN